MLIRRPWALKPCSARGPRKDPQKVFRRESCGRSRRIRGSWTVPYSYGRPGTVRKGKPARRSDIRKVHLYGGPPEASTRIKIVTTDNVTGEEASWRSPETCSRGGCVDATYNVDSFDYSIFEREHTLNAYSDDGNLIGTWTGIFTKDFFSDET